MVLRSFPNHLCKMLVSLMWVLVLVVMVVQDVAVAYVVTWL